MSNTPHGRENSPETVGLVEAMEDEDEESVVLTVRLDKGSFNPYDNEVRIGGSLYVSEELEEALVETLPFEDLPLCERCGLNPAHSDLRPYCEPCHNYNSESDSEVPPEEWRPGIEETRYRPGKDATHDSNSGGGPGE